MALQVDASLMPALVNRLSVDDFETASIRSAAPSYTSEAPSYHSTLLHTESIPAYTPPAGNAISPNAVAGLASIGSHHVNFAGRPAVHERVHSLPALLPSQGPATIGLPPAPRRASDHPALGQFRIPTWSSLAANPSARHYQSVAHRRACALAAASVDPSSPAPAWATKGLERVAEEDVEASRIRPLEDPYLVGEVAAARAKAERLAKENGDDVLYREDKRWDWFLAQMKDWDERERSWKQFRRDVETRSQGRLARRIGVFR